MAVVWCTPPDRPATKSRGEGRHRKKRKIPSNSVDSHECNGVSRSANGAPSPRESIKWSLIGAKRICVHHHTLRAPCPKGQGKEFQIGLCGVVEADLELFCNCWFAGVLEERLYVKEVEEEDAWLRSMGGRGGNYEDGRRPGSLGITVAVKQRQLQMQKLRSQPQPPAQTMWEGHPSRRGPTPWRLGRRARARGLIVLGCSTAPSPTSPALWIALC